MMRSINPAELGAPRGYSNGMLAPAGGRLLFVAGQIGWDRDQKLVSNEFSLQFAQALRNVLRVVREAGGLPEHVGRLTIYVVDHQEYTREAGAVGAGYRALMGKHYPAMALVEVKALLEPGAKVEIEATAVLP
jgi:enamine deaminase RidA (YjgF/YER057c/UK114 family)